MQIGAIGFQPYIYNTNAISSASMNKISGIPNDVTAAKTDFSGLVSGETTNTLKKGETSNFMDVLAQQLSLGQSAKSRISTVEDPAEQSLVTDPLEQSNQTSEEAMEDMGVETAADMAKDTMTSAATAENENYASDNQQNLYRMNKAIEAYSSM